MKKPLVSVVIAVYNGENYLEQAVHSVEKSFYKNFEIVLVNDGSTDNTGNVCKQLAKKYRNIRYFSYEKNKGLSDALNFALKRTRGEFIARMNHDDIMVQDRLLKQVRFLKNHPQYVLIGGALELINEQGKSFDLLQLPATDEEIRKSWLYLNAFADPAVMYRKSAFLKTNGYNQYYYPADDYHLWYRLGQFGKVANLKTVVTKFRVHRKAATMRRHRLLIQKTWEIHQWAAQLIQKPTPLISLYWKIQYALGMILPVEFNFYVYRWIKKAVYLQGPSFKHLLKMIKTARTPNHPKKLSFSGQ